MTTRPVPIVTRAAFMAGIAVIAAYAALAAWSGSLSPLARGPLLDGLGPVNYRWVSPPPGLAATNQEPSSGRFALPLLEGGVGTQVVFTSDSQVTIVIDDGSIGPRRSSGRSSCLVEPVDPAGLDHRAATSPSSATPFASARGIGPRAIRSVTWTGRSR